LLLFLITIYLSPSFYKLKEYEKISWEIASLLSKQLAAATPLVKDYVSGKQVTHDQCTMNDLLSFSESLSLKQSQHNLITKCDTYTKDTVNALTVIR